MPNEHRSLIDEVKENILFLQELGVSGLEADLTVLQKPRKASKPVEQQTPSHVPPPEDMKIRPEKEKPTPKSASPRSFQDALNASKLSKFDGSDKSEASPTSTPLRSAAETVPVKKADDSLFGDISPSNALAPSEETLDGIHRSIEGCKLCRLWEGRTQIVNSTGNPQAQLMFIGEAPGADEDAQGKPFVGRAGQLLTKIIEAMGLSRDEVFIGNINRCRPPANRTPLPDEATTCKPYLLREIAVVRPKVIVVLGATAMQNLLETKTPIGKLRGNFQDYFGIPVMPTFHPAYLLRDPHKKREVWDDMKKVKAALEKE